MKAKWAIVLSGVVMAAGSCARQFPAIPVNQADYDRARASSGPSWPDNTTISYNLRRVWDESLPAEARSASLELALRLGGDQAISVAQLGELLRRPGTPSPLHRAVLTVLLRKGDAGVAEYALDALDNRDLDPKTRDAILQWLTMHPHPEVMGQVVKLWAQEPSASGPNETRYRRILDQLTGKSWRDALLDGINAEAFPARGSALEILLARVSPTDLRGAIMALSPRADAMSALQAFLRHFDYLPPTGGDFLTAAYLHKTRPHLVPFAVATYRKWRTDHGYVFDVRDFHLLSRLAQDDTRPAMSRANLVSALGRSLGARPHVHRRGESASSEDFPLQVDNLTIADLWRLYLLDEMLSRPRIRSAVRVMAERDLSDRRSAWGGLIYCENGLAEAKLYPAAAEASGNDNRYVPSRYMVTDSRDSLCRLYAHFEKVKNADRAGPDAEELAEAARDNFCAVVLSRLDEDRFAAHYYTPTGVVVSLGQFALGE